MADVPILQQSGTFCSIRRVQELCNPATYPDQADDSQPKSFQKPSP